MVSVVPSQLSRMFRATVRLMLALVPPAACRLFAWLAWLRAEELMSSAPVSMPSLANGLDADSNQLAQAGAVCITYGLLNGTCVADGGISVVMTGRA
jgi:hypothetical protein